MPWLTPDEIPEGTACRPLFIPDSTDWLAIVSGAIDTLTKNYNWEQFGTLTPEQCAERMNDMLNLYYEEMCNDCLLPDGGRVIRINFDGFFEELINGAWVAPEGDYALPPVPERTGGTPSELRCLAAANAENVLKILYEEVTDIWNLGVSAGEGLTLFAAAIGVTIVAAVGLLAGAVMTLALIAFGEFFAFLDFIGEDVWTSGFSEMLRCMLYQCASDDGEGVITFDVNCVWQKLQDNTEFDPTSAEIRLLGQVGYLLSILGADGLNLAGATTAITEADCTDCGVWCKEWSDALGWDGWELRNAGEGALTANGWETLTGVLVTTNQWSTRVVAEAEFSPTIEGVELIEIEYTYSPGSVYNADARQVSVYTANGGGGLTLRISGGITAETDRVVQWTGHLDDFNIIQLNMWASGVRVGSSVTDGNGYISRVRMSGVGANPFVGNDCPPP